LLGCREQTRGSSGLLLPQQMRSARHRRKHTPQPDNDTLLRSFELAAALRCVTHRHTSSARCRLRCLWGQASSSAVMKFIHVTRQSQRKYFTDATARIIVKFSVRYRCSLGFFAHVATFPFKTITPEQASRGESCRPLLAFQGELAELDFAHDSKNERTTRITRSYTWLSSPSVRIIKKNRHDQRGDTGINVTPFGYAIKARPGPLSATLSMSTPCSCAMKPKKANITNPAKKLVPELIMASRMQSL